ncbi:hypothetical protein JCM13304A_13410 [Desulfothermus okinawensis JCM 13304]
MIKFKKYNETVEFHSPKKNFEKIKINLEVREDPLTGYRSIINEYLVNKRGLLYPDTDYEYLNKIGEKSKKFCFMCDGNLEKMTPYYPEEFFGEGRLKYKDAVLFPNLYPLSKFHAVVRLTSEHFKKLGEIDSTMIFNGLKLAFKFLKKSFELDKKYKYPTINANFMFPSGASATHPHFQIMNFFVPSTYHQLLLDRSREYFEKNSSCYFLDLVKTEKELGQRYIGDKGNSIWISAYSPMGRNEIQVIWPKKENFSQFTDNDIKDLSNGLEKVFSYFHSKKISTYNFSILSGPLNESAPYYRCVMKIVNRQNVVKHHRTDDYFLQKILKNELSEITPEDLAKEIREVF